MVACGLTNKHFPKERKEWKSRAATALFYFKYSQFKNRANLCLPHGHFHFFLLPNPFPTAVKKIKKIKIEKKTKTKKQRFSLKKKQWNNPVLCPEDLYLSVPVIWMWYSSLKMRLQTGSLTFTCVVDIPGRFISRSPMKWGNSQS